MNTNDQLLVGRERLERIAKTCMFTLANEDYSAICELLAARPGAVEPVAWIVTDMNGDSYFAYDKQTPSDKPLFAHPPRDVAANDWETLAGQVFELGYRYWKAAVAERGQGAFQWLRNDETGATFVFTRGEYSDELINFFNTLPYAQQQPSDVAAEEPLLCDYCGAVTDDPWHSSSTESKHLHQCDTCHAKAAGGVVLPERDESLGTAEMDLYANGYRHGWNAYADEYARLNGPERK